MNEREKAEAVVAFVAAGKLVGGQGGGYFVAPLHAAERLRVAFSVAGIGAAAGQHSGHPWGSEEQHVWSMLARAVKREGNVAVKADAVRELARTHDLQIEAMGRVEVHEEDGIAYVEEDGQPVLAMNASDWHRLLDETRQELADPGRKVEVTP